MANEVPIYLKLMAEKTSSVNSVIDETKKGFQSIAGSLTDLGRSATQFTGLATLALGGMLGGALKIAGEFEQLQNKLTAVLGDATRAQSVFQSAVQRAASTPFSVKEIVSATVTLEAFGQSSQRLLPTVTNLAAAMGKRVEDVGQIIGKAFSGNLEGLESLRNTLNVSNRELAKFGAVLTKTGSVSVSSSVDLEKFQHALEKLVATKFGTATEQQSKTLFGALSNLADAGERLAASFGTALIPLFTTLTKALTSVVEGFERMPEGLRTTLAIGTVLTVGLGAMATVVVSLGVGFLSAAASATAFAASLGGVGAAAAGAAAGAGAAGAAAGAAGAGFAAGGAGSAAAAVGFARIGAAVAGLAESAAVFTAISLGAAIASVASVAGVAALVLYNMSANARELEAGTRKLSKEMTDSRQGFRDFASAIEKATSAAPGYVAGARDSADLTQRLAQAMKNVPALELSKNLAAAGVTFEDLSKSIDKATQKLNGQRDQLSALIAVQRELEGGQKATSEEHSAVDNLLGKDAGGKIDVVTQAAKTMFVAFKAGAETVDSQTKVQKVLRDTANTLNEATKSAAQFRSYLQVAGDAASIDTLNSLIGQTHARLAEVSAQFTKVSGAAADQASLRKSLLSSDQNEVALAKEIIGLQKDLGGLEKDRDAQVKAGIKAKIDAVEEANRHEEAMGQQNLAREIGRLKELLSNTQIIGAERVKIEEEVHKKEGELQKQRVDKAKESFDDAVSAQRESLEKLRGGGEATSAQIAAALEGVIGKTKAWGQANAALLNQSPELRKSYTTTLQGLQKDLDATRRAAQGEKLDGVFAQNKALSVEATSNAQKLGAVQASIDNLRKLSDSGQITALQQKKRLQDEITRLEHEEVGLQKSVTKEIEDQTRQTNQVKRDGLEQNLELLKAQQEIEGKDNRFKIRQAEQQILAGKIADIEEEAAKERQAAEGNAEAIEQINIRTQERITQVRNDETIKRINANKQEADSFIDQQKRMIQSLQQALGQAKLNRPGGPDSPIISAEELGLESAIRSKAGPGFRTGSIFGSSNGTGLAPQSVSQIQAAVDRDLRAGQSQTLANAKAGNAAAGAPVVQHSQTNVYVGGGKGTTNQDIEEGAQRIQRGAQRLQETHRIFNGPASPRGVA